MSTLKVKPKQIQLQPQTSTVNILLTLMMTRKQRWKVMLCAVKWRQNQKKLVLAQTLGVMFCCQQSSHGVLARGKSCLNVRFDHKKVERCRF